MLSVFLRALRTALNRASPGAPGTSDFAALSFPQRFGSSLNAHFHFHVLALDGVFREEPEDSGEIVFHEATLLTPEHWHKVERTVQRRVLRLFKRRGFLEADTVQDMLGWQASGGFSVDASVRVEGDDRAGVERLVRYCARPPLALERLQAVDGQESLVSEGARLIYRLPDGDVEGRSQIVLTPLELLARLAVLIPPPRVHRHRYHGVLAPHARLRAAVVAIGRAAAVEIPVPVSAPPLAALPLLEPKRPSRIPWAELLARIYEVLPLLCPACGGEMRILAFVTEPPTVQAILLHLGLPHRPPHLTPARGPPQAEIDFDQSAGCDPLAGDPGPELEFDQSVPDDFGA